MTCWCRLCRAWVNREHFLLKDGSWEGCGQGRSDIRYHPSNPLCGDIWRLPDGSHLVVDYVDSFNVGVTFSDGKRAGVKYRDSFRAHVQGASLVSTWEEWPYSPCDFRGWTRKEDFATAEHSLRFLSRRLQLIERDNND